MGKFGGSYAKWNIPTTEIQILLWSHLHGKSKEVKLIQPESQMLAVRSKGVGEIDVVQSVQSFNYKVTVFLGFKCIAWWL